MIRVLRDPSYNLLHHDMLADDNFMTAKMDHIVVGSGAGAHFNFISDKWTEQVQISMFDRTIWSGARLPLKMQERWKWVLTHYDIEHTLWKYPHNYILNNCKQAALMGYHIQECDPSCFLLLLEDLCKVEKQSHGEGGACMNASQKQLMSMLWKVGEGNPIKGSQPPLLCDVSLEMHCLQLVHKTLHKTNTYHMDDRNEKANFVDPDWEVITADLVHEMVHQYMLQGRNIPFSFM